MIQINQIGEKTELQIVSGGGYLTESYPTNFHNFFKRKMLTANETIEDFKEVTAAQKATIEESDAMWQCPTDEFISDFNYLANRVVNNYGGYNVSTGFFELGDVKDITYAQARKIVLSAGSWITSVSSGSPKGLFAKLDIRATFPLSLSGGGQGVSMVEEMFYHSSVEEVYLAYGFATVLNRTFERCTKLKKITIGCASPVSTFYLTFESCVALETIIGLKTSKNLDLHSCPKLTITSVAQIVTLAANTTEITITVHPDVFAKLTDESNEEWHAILLAAAEKQINFATV